MSFPTKSASFLPEPSDFIIASDHHVVVTSLTTISGSLGATGYNLRLGLRGISISAEVESGFEITAGFIRGR